jgi:hypothetical protein
VRSDANREVRRSDMQANMDGGCGYLNDTVVPER